MRAWKKRDEKSLYDSLGWYSTHGSLSIFLSLPLAFTLVISFAKFFCWFSATVLIVHPFLYNKYIYTRLAMSRFEEWKYCQEQQKQQQQQEKTTKLI